VDGDELLGQPWNMIMSGNFNRGTPHSTYAVSLTRDERANTNAHAHPHTHTTVPLLLGTVSEEAWPFIFQAASKPLSESLYVLTTAYLFNIDVVSVSDVRHAPKTHAHTGRDLWRGDLLCVG
jgi:hypothetical protein